MSDLLGSLGGLNLTPEQLAAGLAKLSPEHRAALSREAQRSRIGAYVAALDLGFAPERHHKLLIKYLEALERGDIPYNKLMILMPPGSAKSTYTSVIFPSWYLGRNPTDLVLAASNTSDLAEHFGRRVRNIFGSPEHHAVFGVGLSPDTQAAGNWMTSQGGGYYAAGVGSAIAGRRADVGLIDDPVASREDAYSDRMREKTWQWYINDFIPRLKPRAKQIVIMTRWHEDDLGGRILLSEEKEWTILKLPMEAGRDDPLGREPGERLWPEWFTERQVEDAKKDVSVWNSLYQQEPTGVSGDFFKADWFQPVDERPHQLTYYGASDYAVSQGKGDWTEHGIFGVDSWDNIYILDWWRGQTTSDEWIDAQCNLIQRYRPLCWFGESGVIKRAIEPYLLRRMEERRAYCRIEWLSSIHDKTTRCRPFQAMAASGKVFVPRVANWKADVLGQLLRFPAGMHDDVVDVCSLIGRGLEHVEAPQFMKNHNRQTQAIVRPSRFKRYAGR
jgi:predicted phage terminase large subunit-like protein